MFKVYISGLGAEVTQGILPIETAIQIREEVGDGSFATYFMEGSYEDDKIDWYELSGNPAAIEILKENQDKIKWTKFTLNPSIFKNN